MQSKFVILYIYIYTILPFILKRATYIQLKSIGKDLPPSPSVLVYYNGKIYVGMDYAKS